MRAVLLAAAIGTATCVQAGPADPPTAADIEEVVVTGSRIRRDPADAAGLRFRLEADDKDRSGLTSLSDILARLPVSGSPLNTRFNSSGNFGFPADGGGVAAGASHVDLRHLGAKRVLVLVDGLRWVHGASASGVSGASDLNTIPAGIVERVEASLEGASAIYGSDAIAGVVNIVTAHVQGLKANVYRGGYQHGGETSNVELALGGERGRTTASLHASFAEQRRISADAQERTRWPFPGTGTRHGSSFTPQGRVVFADPLTGEFVNCALDPGVVGKPVYQRADPCGPNDDYHPWSNADRFNYAPYNLVVTPSRRFGVFGRIEHELFDYTSFHGRVLFNNRQSVNQAAPEPLWAGTLAESSSLLDDIVIAANSPYNPFGFDIGTGAWATRRPLESGPRVFEQDVDTRYAAFGLDGRRSFLQRTFKWDANVVWSRNVARQTKHGAHNARKMLQAAGPPAACAAIPGCVPLNLLGGQGDGSGTITPDMLAWIGFVQRDYSDQTLRDLTLNVSVDLFELPAGPLAFATGFEHRRLHGRFTPDPVVAAGDTAGIAAEPTAGGHRSSEWFAELEAPIVDTLDLALAVRRFHYDTFGADTAARAGLVWRPTTDLLFRASWAQGFRAPTIGELFGGQTRLDAVIADPCSDFRASGAGEDLIAACAAAGVPQDGSYAQLGSQIPVRTGGNDRLQPETSRSVAFALAWQPQWMLELAPVEDFRVEISHYAHEVEDAITAFNAQTVLDGCYKNGQAAFCGFIERNRQGHIRRFDNTLLNIGIIRTSGWDIGIVSTATLAAAGRLRLQWRSTYLQNYDERLLDTQGALVETRHLVGKTESDRGKPRWKSMLNVDWMLRAWQLSWGVRYIHGMTERCSNFLDGSPDSFTSLGLCSMPNQVDDAASRNRLRRTIYHDASARYSLFAAGGEMAIRLGVNNLLDRDPPVSMSASLNGYDASTYDIPGGRFPYAQLSFER